MDFRYNQQLIWAIRAIILATGGYFFLTQSWFLPPEVYVKEVAEPQEIQLLGWIPYWDQENSFEAFKENVGLLNYISVFWYRLDQNGNIKTYDAASEDKAIIDFAHKHNVKVLAAIANLPNYLEGGDWDYRRVDKVISSRAARKAHIQALVELAAERNFDGINIDYEALKRGQRENFTAFVEELAEALHEKGKLLGVAIHPKTSENNPAENNGSEAQDWRKLSESADQLYFMTYSEHYRGSFPGPNASPAWIDKILNYAVNEVKVPREKIFMGIPFYGHEWVQNRFGLYRGIDDDLTFDKAISLSERYEAEILFDKISQTPYLTYERDGETHVVWFENVESLKAKLELREKYNIPNLAFWRLGGEDPEVWNELRGLKKK